jgi:hypothetical protein
MALRGSNFIDNVPNPYEVSEADSGRVNAALTVGGDALPLINLIMSMTDRRFKPVFEHLSVRIESLERQVAELTRISHTHVAVQAVQRPTLPGTGCVLDGKGPPEVPNSGWDGSQSQEEDTKDIKF